MAHNDARQVTGCSCQQILKKARKQLGVKRLYTTTRWSDSKLMCFAIFKSAAEREADARGELVEYLYATAERAHALAFFEGRKSHLYR